MNVQILKGMKSVVALRRWLMFWELFVGLGAVMGAVMMFIEPEGGEMFRMTPLLGMMQVLPFAGVLFRNFIFPALALLFVNGIPNFIAFYLLIRHHRLAPVAGIVCGVLLMLWICVQFVIFTFNPMSASYFIFGAAEALAAYLLLRKVRGEYK